MAAKKTPLAQLSWTKLQALFDALPDEVTRHSHGDDYFELDEKLPACCGIKVIGDFTVSYKLSAEELVLFAYYVRDVLSGAKFAIATTGKGKEQNFAAQALKIIGFKMVDSFVNPNSRNKITVWSLKLGKSTQ